MTSAIREKLRAVFNLAGGGIGSVLIVAVTVGTALRFYDLDAESLWLDELFTADRSNPEYGFIRLVEELPRDVHPPLYIIFMYYWSAWFGQSEYALRLPSALFAIATLVFVAVYYWKFVRGMSFTIIFGLFAISPGAVYYAQEARSYSLLLLLSTIVTGHTINIVQNIRSSIRITYREFVIFFTVCIFTSYTHYFGFIITTACFATIFLFVYRKKEMKYIISTYCLIVLLFAPWVFYNYLNMSTAGSWISFRPIHDMKGMLNLAFGKSWILYPLLFLLILNTPNLLKKQTLSNNTFVTAIIIITFSILIAVAISLHTPILTSRNLIILLPALYIMSAELAENLLATRRRKWRFAFSSLALLTIATVMAVENQKSIVRTEKPQYRESAQFVTSLPECRMANILVGGPFLPAYEFYTNRAQAGVEINFMLARPMGPATPQRVQDVLADDCPVIIWLAHGSRLEPELRSLFSEMGIDKLIEHRFHGAAVFLEP